ncbi:hypothetical protein [Clostridium sp. YIM B02569]|jgi:predicted transcriptional regulator|uniref:hypothetical protein n=1 Tax=Clostridium sp. YIM B02569 TaxID=2911967 RepID=UPI001EEAB8F3|nr:hypothetical protein [Clostridium sp. YIM B02569]
MTPIMSFWPSIYNKIKSQEKLVEYRRRFPEDCQMAYMYVSKPVKAICGIIYFGQIHSLEDWKTEYSNDANVEQRIDDYINSYRYGAEIIALQEIQPISLDSLRENISGFVAPQSYLLLENNERLKDYISSNTYFIGNRIYNNTTNIFPEHICKRY